MGVINVGSQPGIDSYNSQISGNKQRHSHSKPGDPASVTGQPISGIKMSEPEQNLLRKILNNVGVNGGSYFIINQGDWELYNEKFLAELEILKKQKDRLPI